MNNDEWNTAGKPVWQADWSALTDAEVQALTQHQGLTSWLLETGSLTARLKGLGAFSLQLLSEQAQSLPAFLQQRWQCDSGTCREVVMSLAQQPVIYAQSFWPGTTADALLPLARLGALPLGEYIFAQPDLQRSAIEVAVLDAWQLPGIEPSRVPATPPASGAAAAVTGARRWFARRSFFQVSGHELLVQEVFLASLPAGDRSELQQTGVKTA